MQDHCGHRNGGENRTGKSEARLRPASVQIKPARDMEKQGDEQGDRGNVPAQFLSPG